MAAVILLLLVVVIIFILSWYWQYFKYNKYLKKYPGPFSLPIIGNAHKFSSTREFLKTSMELTQRYDCTFKLMFGFRPRLFVIDHKLGDFILGSTAVLEKSFEYDFFHPWLGTGLLTSSSEKWKKQRKLITPTFHFQILEQFMNVFDTQSTVLVKKLSNKVGKDSFDVVPYIGLCTLDIICEAAMGTLMNAQKDSRSDYVTAIKEMCRILMERSFNPLKMWNVLFSFTNDYHLEKKAIDTLHSYSNSVIKKRKAELHASAAGALDDSGTGVKKKLAFLDLLLQSSVDGNPLSDESIREEVDTFMFEGHDTTTAGISFTLYCLGKNQEVQKKVVEELRFVLDDDKDRALSYKDFQELKYLDMVIKESMRLYPPVPHFSRILDKDVEFEGEILPKGLGISIFPFGLHRRETVFPDPLKFDPERFSPENTVGRRPYEYIPFSAGPRNCIGQKFAMLEMKSTISKILRNFEIFPDPGHVPVLAAVAILTSENGLKLKLKQRVF